MLPLFRRKKSWLKWVLVLVIAGLGISTVFLFVGTPTGFTTNPGGQEVAVVAGERITAAEFRRQYLQLYDFYRQAYNLDQQDPEIVKQLGIGQQALNQLISEYAIGKEAENLGITVATDEVVERISQFPVFQENGSFIGADRYRQILMANNLTPSEFEEAVRRSILRQKFQNVLTDGIIATPQDVRQQFLDANQGVRVRYAYFGAAEAMQGAVDEEKLQEFFEENQEDYRQSEQRSISYVALVVDPSTVEVTEEQIQAQLSQVPEEEQVRARHILIRATTPDEESVAQQQAEELLRQLRNGADFRTLAQRHSDDPVSATQGGDLGYFTRGQMVPEFEDAAFEMDEGELNLVQSPFGFHVIQVLGKAENTPEGRRKVAEFNARVEEADEQTAARAQRIAEAVREGSSLEEVASAESLEVQETGLFPAGGQIPGLTAGSDFIQIVFSLREGEITDPHSAANQYIIARLEEIQPARIPPLEEIREQIVADFRTSEGDALAREQAFDFYRQIEEGAEFEELANESEREVTVTEFFNKGDNIDDILRFSPEVHNRAFSLSEGEVSAPVKVADNYVVFEVVEKSEVDEELFQQQKAELSKEVSERKRNEFFTAYVRNLVDQLRRNDQITINQQLVNQLTS